MKDIKSPAFRTAIGGFNKQDVNGYIARLCRDYEEAIAEKTEASEKLRASLNTANEELDALRPIAESKSGAEEALDKANSVIAAQTEQLSELKEKSDAQANELDTLKAKLERYSEMETKFSQYESTMARMGEIFMEATADAERIRTEAKTYAETLTETTENDCRSRRAECEAQLVEFITQRKNELSKMFSEAQTEIDRILGNFGDASTACDDKNPAEECLAAVCEAGTAE